MKFCTTYYFILLTIAFGCEQKSNTLNKEKVTSEILNMFDNYHDAIKAGGLEAEFNYLDKSSDFFWVPPGYESALSYDSVQSILISNSKLINTIEFSFDTIQIVPITDSIANYSGIVSGKMTDTTNTVSFFKIIESGTLIKREDGWKLLNGQTRNLQTPDN